MAIVLFFTLISTSLLNTSPQHVERGLASYYGHKFQGKKTASGELYDKNKLTAAHKTLPFGTKVRVTNEDNDLSVVVKVNDRGPFVKNRIIDLSFKAAKQIEIIDKGVGKVKIQIVAKHEH